VTLPKGLKAVLLFVVLMIGLIEVYALSRGVDGVALSGSLGALGALGGYVARRSDLKAELDK
jgi:hypothetical protein